VRQVLEEIQNKRKAYENSAMGKLANFGSTLNKMVGGEGSESEPESDVSVCAGDDAFSALSPCTAAAL
jgi:hypothetical protein